MLARGETHKGLMSAFKKQQWEIVLRHVEWKLRLPDDYTPTRRAPINRSSPTHSPLRLLLVGLVNQLVALSKSASDKRNPTPQVLKNSIAAEVHAAFDALAQTCERLEVVAGQGVDPARLGTCKNQLIKVAIRAPCEPRA